MLAEITESMRYASRDRQCDDRRCNCECAGNEFVVLVWEGQPVQMDSDKCCCMAYRLSSPMMRSWGMPVEQWVANGGPPIARGEIVKIATARRMVKQI